MKDRTLIYLSLTLGVATLCWAAWLHQGSKANVERALRQREAELVRHWAPKMETIYHQRLMDPKDIPRTPATLQDLIDPLIAALDQIAAEARAEDELDITEAVFYHLFAGDGFVDTNKVYYLCLNGMEPPESIMKRFAHHSPPVAKAATYGGQRYWFAVGKIEWVDHNTVRVECAHVLGSTARGKGQFIFRMVRKAGKWNFEEMERGQVS